MYAIRMPSGRYLEGQFSLGFELNNQVFSTSDATTLPGSFSFPADVILTGANKIELDNPHLVTNADNWRTYPNVWVELYGHKIFTGILKITGCNQTKAKVTIVATPLAGLKEKKLDSLALGGARTWSGALDAHMKVTARLPEDWDYAFFPIFTADEMDATSSSRYQNKFNTGTDTFDTTNTVVTPFLRLDYLLSQIFNEAAGDYHFDNRFQTTTELRRLYVYNNADARVSLNAAAPTLPTELYLNRHLPALKCAEFLKMLAAQWCLGVFTNIFSQRIALIPLRDVLRRPPAHNWSEYAIGDQPLDSRDSAPNVFGYPDQESLPGAADPHLLPLYKTVAEYATAAETLPVGYYYVESETCIFHIIRQIPGTTFQEQHYVHRAVHLDAADKPLDGVMGAVFDGQNYCRTQSGITRYRPKDDGSGGTTHELAKEDAPAALVLYRGWSSGDPKSRNHVWEPSSAPATRSDIYTDGVSVGTSEVSLMWFGEYGLYEKWHLQWSTLLRNGKHVTQMFDLPVSALTEFSFQDKIRVANMDYFVKKLRINTPTGHGRVLVEASLVSVI